MKFFVEMQSESLQIAAVIATQPYVQGVATLLPHLKNGEIQPAQPPSVSVGPPATAAEAQQRFFARYGEIIGGSSWENVRAYLRRPRAVEPAPVATWIASAKAIRDHSRAQAATPAAPAQRQYAQQ